MFWVVFYKDDDTELNEQGQVISENFAFIFNLRLYFLLRFILGVTKWEEKLILLRNGISSGGY